MLKRLGFIPFLAGYFLLLTNCSDRKNSAETATEKKQTEATSQAMEAVAGIQPVDLPDPRIPGFSFPDTVNINTWVSQRDSAKIYLHGWGLWTALCAPTAHRNGDGDTVRVFETWRTKLEIDSIINAPPASAAALRRSPGLGSGPQHALGRPSQFFRDARLIRRLQVGTGVHSARAASSEAQVYESVAYSPLTADTIIHQKLFWASSLQKMLDRGDTFVSSFPGSAMAIKPMYEIVPGPQRSKGRLFKLKVWPGAAGAPTNDGYGQAQWRDSVYIDIANHGQGRGLVAHGLPVKPASIYNLRDFVHFTLSAAEVRALKAGKQNLPTTDTVQVGDYAVLVGMHITTNEIGRWTWQTLWWTPNPDRAPDPSSSGIIAARPRQLTGAPRHYAMSIAYQMISPVQPLTGGHNVGNSVYAYNPYLEAPFSPATFLPSPQHPSLKETAVVITNGISIVNNTGVHTNCMSCHAQASFIPTASKALPLGYLADTYVDGNAPKFKGKLQTDFLWSIADMATTPRNSKR